MYYCSAAVCSTVVWKSCNKIIVVKMAKIQHLMPVNAYDDFFVN